jgi:phosphatidylglycerophosphatase A
MNKRLLLARLIATWFGCGLSPFAPGTVGSAAALAIGALLYRHAGFLWWEYLVLAAVLFGPAVWAAGVTARAAKIEDPSFVVVDEVIGQWIALAGAQPLNWKSCLAAFLLFRLFDIWKPAPVRQLERLPGGLGINADDVMAGIYAALVLYLAGCYKLY